MTMTKPRNRLESTVSECIRRGGDHVVIGVWHDHQIAVHVCARQVVTRCQPEQLADYIAVFDPHIVEVDFRT